MRVVGGRLGCASSPRWRYPGHADTTTPPNSRSATPARRGGGIQPRGHDHHAEPAVDCTSAPRWRHPAHVDTTTSPNSRSATPARRAGGIRRTRTRPPRRTGGRDGTSCAEVAASGARGHDHYAELAVGDTSSPSWRHPAHADTTTTPNWRWAAPARRAGGIPRHADTTTTPNSRSATPARRAGGIRRTRTRPLRRTGGGAPVRRGGGIRPRGHNHHAELAIRGQLAEWRHPGARGHNHHPELVPAAAAAAPAGMGFRCGDRLEPWGEQAEAAVFRGRRGGGREPGGGAGPGEPWRCAGAATRAARPRGRRYGAPPSARPPPRTGPAGRSGRCGQR